MKDQEASIFRDMLPEVHVVQEMALNYIKAERTAGRDKNNRKAEKFMETNQEGCMEMNNSYPAKTESRTEINLGGDLSVGRAGELRQIISESLNTGKQIVLACSESADMDLSFLQLVCSAHRTALQSNSLLKLSDSLEKQLLIKAGEAGYFRETACRSDKNHECFWLRR